MRFEHVGGRRDIEVERLVQLSGVSPGLLTGKLAAGEGSCDSRAVASADQLVAGA